MSSRLHRGLQGIKLCGICVVYIHYLYLIVPHEMHNCIVGVQEAGFFAKQICTATKWLAAMLCSLIPRQALTAFGVLVSEPGLECVDA